MLGARYREIIAVYVCVCVCVCVCMHACVSMYADKPSLVLVGVHVSSAVGQTVISSRTAGGGVRLPLMT